MAQNGRQRFALIFAYVVSGLWSVSFIVDMASDTYAVDTKVTGLVLIIAGWAYREGLPKFPKRKDDIDGRDTTQAK